MSLKFVPRNNRSDSSQLFGKYRVSQPGDPLELETDRVATDVLRMPDSPLPMIPRGCAACDAAGSICPVCALPGESGQSAGARPKVQRQQTEEEETELQRQPVEGEEEMLLQHQPDGASIPVSGRSLSSVPSVQTKLAVSEADDEYEKEADRVADRVMRMPQQEDEPEIQRKIEPSRVQRICEGCEEELQRQPEEEEEEPEVLQTKGETGGQSSSPQLSDTTAGQIESLRGGGEPLSSEMRSYFEPMFGRDFGLVRVHTRGNAPRIAKALNARAFTVRQDVVMGSGEYTPQTSEGKRLMAHELTHVVQQGAAAPKMGPSSVLNSDTGRARISPKIQRTTYPDCTVADQTIISTAVSQATTDLTTAITALTTRPLTSTVTDALYLAFRSDTVSTADTVRDRLQTILNSLPGADFECEYPSHFLYNHFCPTNTYGFSRTKIGAWGNIHICTPTFVAMTANDRSHGVIHESAHVYLQVRDKGYFVTSTCEETAQTAGDPYTHRLNNSDSYACIVNFLSRGVPADITRRADEYRGGNLTMVQNPTGIIDLNSGTPKSPLFELRGIPRNSGFVERWVIDDQGTRYLMWSDTGNPFRYGQYTETYIPSRTRALLASRLASGSLTAPEVLCRVRLTREPHFRVSAPTVLLTMPVTFTT